MRLILGACKQGLAAVVVTHDAQLASWADRVVFLRDGRVVDQTVPLPEPGIIAAAQLAAMSTALLDRPTTVAARTTGHGVAARRAVVRWAWRLFRQRMAPATARAGARRRGRGRHHRRFRGRRPTIPRRRAPDSAPPKTRRPSPVRTPTSRPRSPRLQHRFGPVDVIENQSLSVPGSISTYDLRAQNPHGPYGQPDVVARLRELPDLREPGGGDRGRGVRLRPEGR